MRKPTPLWCVVLLLAACSPPPDPGVGEREAQARRELALYQSMRDAGQYTLAETQAERIRTRFAGTSAPKALRDTLDDTHARAEQQREHERLAELWDYQQVAVGNGEQRTAALYSRVEVDPEAEVEPVPDARLVLRRHPEWGRSAYLLLNQRQLDCGRPCTLSLRFDDAPAEDWRGKPADSGQGPALFIVDEARFLERLRQCRRLRIELRGNGVLKPAFVFEPAGFDADRLDPP